MRPHPFIIPGFLLIFLFQTHLSAQQPAPSSAASKASASMQTASKGSISPDYMIREGDTVQVSVFNEPELTAGGRVRKDGTIQCPLIGSVKILGLGQADAARLIEEAYRKDYLVNPEVNLYVSQFTVQRVTVLGQVQRPGAHELPAEKNLTLLQVLGMAGGPTRVANLKKVLLKRIQGGREEIIRVDVSKMFSGDDSMMVFVQEDDVITVPEGYF